MNNKKNLLKSDVLFGLNISELLSKKTIVSILMFFSGVVLLYFVGFAQGSGNLIHNAVHDTRHAAGFPCH